MSIVNCLAAAEAEQTFQGPVFVTVCKFLCSIVWIQQTSDITDLSERSREVRYNDVLL